MEEKKETAPVAKLVITCNVQTGVVEVGGHIDNLLLNLQMLNEAGHMLIGRHTKLQDEAKKNGHAPPPDKP